MISRLERAVAGVIVYIHAWTIAQAAEVVSRISDLNGTEAATLGGQVRSPGDRLAAVIEEAAGVTRLQAVEDGEQAGGGFVRRLHVEAGLGERGR